jgi:predicted amidohydrolase
MASRKDAVWYASWSFSNARCTLLTTSYLLGSLMVLICADSWYPKSYEAAKRTNAELVLVPSFSSPGPDWTKPWTGYNGFNAPLDVNTEDIGKINLSEAWLKYSLAGRLKYSGARIGAMCYEVGYIWDMQANGQSYVCDPSTCIQQLEASSEEILIQQLQ